MTRTGTLSRTPSQRAIVRYIRACAKRGMRIEYPDAAEELRRAIQGKRRPQ